MMWEHQCDRLRMNPEAILVFLEKAIRGGVPHSAENLEVLRSHIPELFSVGREKQKRAHGFVCAFLLE